MAIFLILILIWVPIFIIDAFLTPSEMPFTIGLFVGSIGALYGFMHPSIISRKLSKTVVVAALIYLIPGTLMNISYLASEAETYVCGDHAIGGAGYKNPDKSRCYRRIEERWVWTSAAAHMLFWPIMILN